MTSIIVYDGSNTIGGNKIFMEENGKGVFLDFGMNFKKYNYYFQEYLKERSSRGIYDLIHLDLIPKLNIYRKELIPPDLDVSGYPSLKIDAVLISHAHMDHFGNIGLLNTDLPIIASPQTLALIKGISDTGSLSMSLEVAFFSKKNAGKSDKTIKSVSGTYEMRSMVCTEPFTSDFESFMSTDLKSAADRTTGNLKALSCKGICDLTNNPTQFDIKCFDVDHSIFGATGYIISGDSSIAYTGDFRLHGKKADMSRKFIHHAKDVSVLIIEGTRTSREDIDESEERVYENCLNVTENVKGIVVADFSGRNFERLEIFEKIANKTGRTVVLPAKQAYLLKALEQVDGVDRTKNILVYDEYKTSKNNWEKNFIENELKYIKPTDILNSPEKFILCFSFYELKHLLDITPRNGTYIYSSSEAFEEESEFDFIRLNHWLKHFDFNVHGFEIKVDNGRERPEFTKGFHASGHASKSDLIHAIEIINPDYIIPVHTENPKWFLENFDNVKISTEREAFLF